MRAVVITKHGGPGVLQVEERPDPKLGPGEVRIDVAAAGINFADVMARLGLYSDAPKPPCVVGYEVAGSIVEVEITRALTAKVGSIDVSVLDASGTITRTIASVGISSQLDRATALELAHDMLAAARAVGQGTAIAR